MYPNQAIDARRNDSGRLEIVVVRKYGEKDREFMRRMLRELKQRRG